MERQDGNAAGCSTRQGPQSSRSQALAFSKFLEYEHVGQGPVQKGLPQPTSRYLQKTTLTPAPRYVCIRGVFILTTECASLTVTLFVTLRKFVSLIFSILYFQNPFTLWHWLGTLFVFIGTLMYTEVWTNLGATKRQPQKEDKKN